MAFIKSFAGAFGGSFADQWLDYLTIPDGLPATVGMCKAVRANADGNRNANTRGSDCVISNGSRIVVPEGYALIVMENGSSIAFVDEPGGYEWHSEDINSQSIFAGGTAKDSIFKKTANRFAFGGVPGVSQIAVFVNRKEIPNNRFGTQNEIYWDDSFLNTQAGATARGAYTLKIADPVLFLKEFVPSTYYSPNSLALSFDFADFENDAATQLFNEVVASLSSAFSEYANSGAGGARISQLQGDAVGFARALSHVVESNYRWRTERGLEIVKASLIALDYDAATKELLSKVQRADALMGSRGNSNLQASFAQGMQDAGSNSDGGAVGLAFMNMAMNAGAGNAATRQPVDCGNPKDELDPFVKLEKMKGLVDKGVISQEEFEAVKKKTLSL